MTATTLYPLRFEPVFRRYLWGGRRLGSVLGKPIGDGDDYAESWEVVDHGADQSRVAYGPLQGRTLSSLRQEFPTELLGNQTGLSQEAGADRFPLLLKYLDCNRPLSVQVHPNDQQAARLSPPDLGKTEAWYIMDAEPGAKLYVGLKQGFDRAALAREVARGTTELCLHVVEPQVGDTLFIPAGVVHALGAGLLVAEIQQASDTTYRLFDWNRVDAQGNPRQLHVAESLDTINYSAGPVSPQRPQPTDRPYAQQLACCDKFVLERWELAAGDQVPLGGGSRFHIITVLRGDLEVAGDLGPGPLPRGQTLLVPACCSSSQLTSPSGAQLLVAALP